MNQIKVIIPGIPGVPGPSGSVAASVANYAALSALNPTAYLAGTYVYVQSYGSYWKYDPSSTLSATPDLVALAIGGGAYIREASGVVYESTLQTTWNIDPIAGSNEGNGTSSPVKEFAEIIRRYGTFSPYLRTAQVTYTWINDAPLSDPVSFVPYLLGNGGVELRGALTIRGTATIGVYTAINRAAGTLATITAVGQGGAFWSAFVGMTVHDTTAGAQFHVIADLGGGTAQITAPKVYPVTGLGADATIANGDALSIYSCAQIPMESLDAQTIGNVSGGGAVVSSATIVSEAGVGWLGSLTQLIECSIRCSLLSKPTFQSASGPIYVSCDGGLGGYVPVSGTVGVFGGVMRNPGNNLLNQSVADGDAVFLQRIHMGGSVRLGRVYFGETPTIDNPRSQFQVLDQNYGSCRLWGPGGLNAVQGTTVGLFRPASECLLLLGSLTCDGGNGSAWTPYGFGPPQAITSAALDANGNLGNPATGSSFYLTNPSPTVVSPSSGPVTMSLGTAATYNSATSIFNGANVERAYVQIVTPYSGGATLSVGRAGSASLIISTGEVDLTAASGTIYDLAKLVTWDALSTVMATIGGSPGAGAAVLVVRYGAPQS